MSSLSSLPTNSGASQRTTPNAAPVPPAKPYDLAIHACKALAAACASNSVADAAHTLGKFSSAAVPAIALDRYAAHLAARMEHGEAGILLGLCLIMRVWRTHRAAPSPDTLHRLLLTATTVAMKAHFDDFYVNKYMARIGGLETAKELGELEAHMFLTLLGGTATVRQKEIRATLDNGMIPIGKEVQKGGIDAQGAARKLVYLLEGDVAPLQPFPAALLAGPKVTPTTTTPAGPKSAGRSPTPHIMPDASAEAGLGPMPAFPSFHGAPSQLPSPHAMSDASPQANRSPHRWAGAQSGGAVSSTHASQLLGAEAGDAALFTPTVSSTAASLVPGHRDLCPSGDSSLRASPAAAHAAGSGARLARSITVTAAPAATGARDDAAPALRDEPSPTTRSP